MGGRNERIDEDEEEEEGEREEAGEGEEREHNQPLENLLNLLNPLSLSLSFSFLTSISTCPNSPIVLGRLSTLATSWPYGAQTISSGKEPAMRGARGTNIGIAVVGREE